MLDDLIKSVMPEMEIKGVAVVYTQDGRPKVDPGFDLALLPPEVREQIMQQEQD